MSTVDHGKLWPETEMLPAGLSNPAHQILVQGIVKAYFNPSVSSITRIRLWFLLMPLNGKMCQIIFESLNVILVQFIQMILGYNMFEIQPGSHISPYWKNLESSNPQLAAVLPFATKGFVGRRFLKTEEALRETTLKERMWVVHMGEDIEGLTICLTDKLCLKRTQKRPWRHHSVRSKSA